MEKGKRERAKNWEDNEKDFLLELVEENKVVEDKGCSVAIQRARQQGWERIWAGFAAKFGNHRSVKEVKSQWGRMKLHAKKLYHERKREAQATGGGRGRSIELSGSMERIFALCPLDFAERTNQFDSDGTMSRYDTDLASHLMFMLKLELPNLHIIPWQITL
jgi:hypothetical protein